MNNTSDILADMDTRARDVFRRIVEGYLTTGEPTGSRTLSKVLSEPVSAATVRNVMQDLEQLGLLDSPHVSAGRIPTQLGLRMFVDGILEVGDPDVADQQKIQSSFQQEDAVSGLLDRVTQGLSGLTHSASLVLAPKKSAPIKHIEFVSLAPDRSLAVLVFSNGEVENRVFSPPVGQTPSQLREAANFLNAVGQGKTLAELRNSIGTEIARYRSELDELTAQLVKDGVAVLDDAGGPNERLIVRGRSNLLDQDQGEAHLDRVRVLFDDLERKRDIVDFLDLAEDGDGVRIFIGSENKLFSLSGSSLVVSPYMNADRKVIGAVGVIGPTRLNYGRIVPIVNYTAQLMGRALSE